MSTRARHPRRTAGASAISLVLHGLFLAAMVAGLRVVQPPPESPPIEIRLMPPIPVSQPATAAAASPQPERAAPRPILRPHPPTLPQAPLPPVPLPEAAPGPPAPPAALQGPPRGLLPSLSGRLGCDDPATFHLNDAQRAVCDQRMAEVAKATKPLALNIDPDKQADFERHQRCHAGATGGALPSSSSHDESTGAQIGGLGFNPRLRDCPPGYR